MFGLCIIAKNSTMDRNEFRKNLLTQRGRSIEFGAFPENEAVKSGKCFAFKVFVLMVTDLC